MNDQIDARIARTRFEAHRWWPYRACAESPDVPGMSAADETVPLTAWLNSDVETQDERHRREADALRLCAGCPILRACLDYALVYEPLNIWGGLTAYRRRELILDRRRAAPTPEVPERVPVTALDVRVLEALSVHRTQTAVARAAGLPVFRANWHRSRLVTFLGLDPRSATRMLLLRAAHNAGILSRAQPCLADRQSIAAIPSRQASVLRSLPVQLALPGMSDFAMEAPTATVRELPTSRPMLVAA